MGIMTDDRDDLDIQGRTVLEMDPNGHYVFPDNGNTDVWIKVGSLHVHIERGLEPGFECVSVHLEVDAPNGDIYDVLAHCSASQRQAQVVLDEAKAKELAEAQDRMTEEDDGFYRVVQNSGGHSVYRIIKTEAKSSEAIRRYGILVASKFPNTEVWCMREKNWSVSTPEDHLFFESLAVRED